MLPIDIPIAQTNITYKRGQGHQTLSSGVRTAFEELYLMLIYVTHNINSFHYVNISDSVV